MCYPLPRLIIFLPLPPLDSFSYSSIFPWCLRMRTHSRITPSPSMCANSHLEVWVVDDILGFSPSRKIYILMQKALLRTLSASTIKGHGC
jgi:hypothetical protein